jgi:hypothetical protein
MLNDGQCDAGGYQPFVTTGGGAGALPFPIGALPTQPAKPRPNTTAQKITRAFFIASPPAKISKLILQWPKQAD